MTNDVVQPGCGWILWCVTCVCFCVVAVVSCLCVAYPPTAVAHGVSNGFEVSMMVIAEP